MRTTDVDHPHAVSALQVEEDGSFVQMGQHGHVLNHVKLWRVHWLQVFFFHHEKLKNTFQLLVRFSSHQTKGKEEESMFGQ